MFVDFVNRFRSERAAQKSSKTNDMELAAELLRLSRTLDRTNDIPTVCDFISGLFKANSRAGFLLLCGSAVHAISEFASRIAMIAHDPHPDTAVLRDRSVQVANPDLRPFKVGRSLEEDLAPWVEILANGDSERPLTDAFLKASREGDLCLITFAIEKYRKDQINCVRRHLESFVEFLSWEAEDQHNGWGSAKFLVMYSIECDEKAEAEYATLEGFDAPFPIDTLSAWRRVTAADIDHWFNWAEGNAAAPAFRGVDLYDVRTSVRQKVCGVDASKEASMREAIDTLYENLIAQHKR